MNDVVRIPLRKRDKQKMDLRTIESLKLEKFDW